MADITTHAQYCNAGGDTPGFPSHGFAITPSDANEYKPPISVYAGGGGIIRVVPATGAGTTVDVTVPAGGMVPFKCKYVYATGLTASLLLGVAG